MKLEVENGVIKIGVYMYLVGEGGSRTYSILCSFSKSGRPDTKSWKYQIEQDNRTELLEPARSIFVEVGDKFVTGVD